MTITVFGIILGVIIILASLVMIVSVLLQKGSEKGLGAVTGQQESFLSKNKGATRDAKLALITKICAGVFVVCCLLFVIFGYTYTV